MDRETNGFLVRVTDTSSRRRFGGALTGLCLGVIAGPNLFAVTEASDRTRHHRKKRRGRRANDRSPDVQAETRTGGPR
jgi:hypothetical protein